MEPVRGFNAAVDPENIVIPPQRGLKKLDEISYKRKTPDYQAAYYKKMYEALPKTEGFKFENYVPPKQKKKASDKQKAHLEKARLIKSVYRKQKMAKELDLDDVRDPMDSYNRIPRANFGARGPYSDSKAFQLASRKNAKPTLDRNLNVGVTRDDETYEDLRRRSGFDSRRIISYF